MHIVNEVVGLHSNDARTQKKNLITANLSIKYTTSDIKALLTNSVCILYFYYTESATEERVHNCRVREPGMAAVTRLLLIPCSLNLG